MVIELDSAPPTDPWWVTRPEPRVSSQSQGPALPYCAVREGDGEREKSIEGLSISKVFNYLHSGPCPTCSLMPADTTNNCQTDDRQIKQSTPVESKGRSSSSVVIFLSTNRAPIWVTAVRLFYCRTREKYVNDLQQAAIISDVTMSQCHYDLSVPWPGFASNNPLVTRGCSR